VWLVQTSDWCALCTDNEVCCDSVASCLLPAAIVLLSLFVVAFYQQVWRNVYCCCNMFLPPGSSCDIVICVKTTCCQCRCHSVILQLCTCINVTKHCQFPNVSAIKWCEFYSWLSHNFVVMRIFRYAIPTQTLHFQQF